MGIKCFLKGTSSVQDGDSCSGEKYITAEIIRRKEITWMMEHGFVPYWANPAALVLICLSAKPETLCYATKIYPMTKETFVDLFPKIKIKKEQLDYKLGAHYAAVARPDYEAPQFEYMHIPTFIAGKKHSSDESKKKGRPRKS